MGRLNISVGGGGGISSDEVTAVLSDVLEGTTALTSDSNDEIGEGTMLDKSGTSQAAEASLDTTNSRLQMNIPETGKYSTASKLYAAYSAIRTLIGLTKEKIATGNTILGLDGTYKGLGDAATGDVLSGKKFSTASLSNAGGSMKNNGAVSKTFTPGNSSQSYTIPAGYHNGSGKVACNAVSNLSAGNIKKGVTVGGVAGSFSGTLKSGSITSQSYHSYKRDDGSTLGAYARTATGLGITPVLIVIYCDGFYTIWNNNMDGGKYAKCGSETNEAWLSDSSKTYFNVASGTFTLPFRKTGTCYYYCVGY